MTVTCFAQAQSTKVDLGRLLTQMRSADRSEREEAFHRLLSDPASIHVAKVQQALLDLLDRENKALESENRESSGPDTAKERDSEEGDTAYRDKLDETVDTFADWSDQNQVCIFVHEAYNPDSKFGAEIAAHARVALPCLLEMSKSQLGANRAEAIPMLVQALAKDKGSIDPQELQAAKQQIINGLHDQYPVVRGETVIAVGAFGDTDMIPALQEVARSDPGSDTRTDNGATWYPIREEANKAIAQIQHRQLQR
jgi:hypothetical protein